MRPLLPLPLLLLLLLLLAAEPGAAPADAELRSRLRESLARKRASARLPRHAAHDFAALQEGAQTALGGRVAAVADSVAGAVDTFHRRAAAVHERVGVTSALRESTRDSVAARGEGLLAGRPPNATHQGSAANGTAAAAAAAAARAEPPRTLRAQAGRELLEAPGGLVRSPAPALDGGA